MVRTATTRPNSVQFLLNSVSDRELDYYSKAERRCRRRILRYSSAIQSVMAHRTAPPRPGRPAIHPPPPPPPRVINPLNMDFLFEKRLQYSDVTPLGRIVIPKFVAELCFPPIAGKEGMWMFVDDMYCEMVWTFRFRFWLNTGSRMYLFDNTRDFTVEKNLDWGDSVKWYKDRVTGTYAISATKNDRLTKYLLRLDNNRNIIVNSALLSPPPCLSLNISQCTENDSEMAQDSAMEQDSAIEQLAVTGEVEATETNPSKTKPSPSFIDTNPLQTEPSFNFIELDDNATALATTAYDELFANPAGGHSFWNFGGDLNDAGMGLSITPALEDGRKLEDVPELGSDPINPFFMSM